MGIRKRTHAVLPSVAVGLLAMVLVAIGLLLGDATVARARDYAIETVDIDATVRTDGSLAVQEDRTFSFDGLFHGVYWRIPKGQYDERDVEASVASAGMVRDGAFVPFEQDPSGADGTYTVTDEGSYDQVTLYSTHEDEDVTFRISYVDTGIVARYEDVGELYWKFVSDGWDVESQDVTCRVHLPVAAGDVVSAGDNVRAWGHGPLDASVAFEGDDVVYQVPGVGTDEYAEARVTFPSAWLPDEAVQPGSALDGILAEEQTAADAANAQRMRARVASLAVLVGGLAVVVATLAVSAHAYRRYKAQHRAQFDDKYFRDVPTDDHPAVLNALLRDGAPDENALPASIMRLCDLKCVTLERLQEDRGSILGVRRKPKEDYRLTLDRRPDGDSPAARIDQRTADYLFREVGGLDDAGPSDASSLRFSDLKEIAQEHPQQYRDSYQSWQGQVSAACFERGYLQAENPARRTPRACGAIGIAAGVLILALGLADVVALAWVAALACLVAGGVCLALARRMDDYTPEGLEVVAKLEALRRWLMDFTRLEEAVPQDVVLWNRLLVMAVALGVSQKVIDQLKAAQPQLYDELTADTYSPFFWYSYGGRGRCPIDALGESREAAHSVSSAALSRSTLSSAGGGGGGFSSGGGGGFGGGGGGGAF